jgi:hypothetical protein
MAVPLSSFHFRLWLNFYEIQSTVFGRLDFTFSIRFSIIEHIDPFLAPSGLSFFKLHLMYHRTTKWHTNVMEHYTALKASDHQAFEVLQSVLLNAFVQQHHARHFTNW